MKTLERKRIGSALQAGVVLTGFLVVSAAGMSVLSVGCASAVPSSAGAASAHQTTDGQPGNSVALSSGGSLSDAVEAIEAGQFAEAKKILDGVLVERGNSPQAHYYQGVALQNLDSNQGAIRHFRTALKLKPQLVEAALNLAAILLDQGDAIAALPVIDDSLKLQPQDPAMLYNRAIALAALGQKKEAAKAYQRASAAAPEDTAIVYGHAEALFRAGETNAARKILLTLIDSNERSVLASAARLLGRLKEFSACVRALDKAMAKELVAELLVSRGLCQHGQKQDAAALLDFQQAQEQDPDFAAAHYYVGMHWKQAGNKTAAKAALERTVALAGNAGIGKAAARALQSL